jgi:hypothetical protein
MPHVTTQLVGPSCHAPPHVPFPPPFFSFLPPYSFSISRAPDSVLSPSPLQCHTPCCSGDTVASATSSLQPATTQSVSSFKLHILYLYITVSIYFYLNLFKFFRLIVPCSFSCLNTCYHNYILSMLVV